MQRGKTSTGTPELKRRILFTFGLLIIFRLGIHIPIPGINGPALADFFATAQNTLFGLFDMFSGGGLSRFSIFALGIMPYISASIILQLLTVVSPELKRLSKEEGAAGRKKITQYTRYGTVFITVIQGMGIAIGLETMSSPAGAPVVFDPGWAFRFGTVVTLTAGTIFIMWLGEQITARGIGNGISLIIFAGIVAGLPSGLFSTMQLVSAGEMSIFILLLILALMGAVLVFITFVERGQRRIPVQYAKRMMGRKLYGGQTSHLPLRVNTAGVIPPIFASSVLMFPATVASFSQSDFLNRLSAYFQPDSIVYNILFVGMIVFFCYFYTAIIFDPKDISENLKKQGGFVPGIRPGLKTQQYIDRVLSRITLWGAMYISAICVLPMILISQFNVPFYFGGTAILIVVGVGMDTMSQVQSHLISSHYDGLMQKAKIKGRY
jgi:preprotein translocase subunit SecY